MDPSPRTHKTPEVTPKTIGRLIHMMNQILIQERYSIRLTMPLATFTPELYSFAKKYQISVHNAFNEADFTDLFQLRLSQTAFLQMQNIQQLMQSLPLTEDDDRWFYSWGSNIFASAKVYRIPVGHEEIHPTYKWLQKSQCQLKHRVFFWLLIKDRPSTRNLLRRKNMHLD